MRSLFMLLHCERQEHCATPALTTSAPAWAPTNCSHRLPPPSSQWPLPTPTPKRTWPSPPHLAAWCRCAALHEHGPVGHVHVEKVDLAVHGGDLPRVAQQYVRVVSAEENGIELFVCRVGHHRKWLVHHCITATSSCEEVGGFLNGLSRHCPGIVQALLNRSRRICPGIALNG